MEGLAAADSTTVTYSKLPAYLQPYTTSPNYSTVAFSHHVGYAPVGYTSATVSLPQLRSAHLEQQSEREPHLNDCGITPSPSGSSSSRSSAENSSDNKDALFLPGLPGPSNFDDSLQGSHHTSGVATHPVPPTPSDSAESSDRDSPNEDRVPRGLLPCKTRVPEESCNGASRVRSSPPAPATPPAHGITVNLLDKELWQTFNSIGNEMIVTKPGR